MSQKPDDQEAATDDLSSLVDGELDAAATARVCGRWRDDAQSRARWHAYQLIGDVLRSEDLASTAPRDAAFLASLRERLAEEPVVLAPTPAVAPDAQQVRVARQGRRSWAAPAAVAAGFMVVAGTLVVTQMTGGSRGRSAAEPLMAGAPAAVPVVAAADRAASVVDFPAGALDGQLVRDVRLDEYLAAHKKFGGSSVSGGPQGYLRNVAVETPAR